MRSRANCHLQRSDHDTLCASSVDPRSRELLRWLSDAGADAADLLDWLGGQGISIHRLENPSRAVLSSLPVPSEFLEPVAREVLARRLAQAIEWLASNTSDLTSFPIESWAELFDIVRRLNDPLLQQSIIRLLETFDAIGTSPFAGDREMRRDFTDLVITHQFDNRYAHRWFALIRDSEADQVLYASLVDATRGLVSAPELIDYSEFERAFLVLCDRIEGSAKDGHAKNRLLDKIRRTIEQRTGVRAYFDIACAAHCERYHWLPEASWIERLVATTPDLAVLSNFMELGSPQLAKMARVKYATICSELQLDPQLKAFAEKHTPAMSASAMETLTRYSRHVNAGR